MHESKLLFLCTLFAMCLSIPFDVMSGSILCDRKLT